ncbi:hypothetical protein OQ968_16530 [Mycobacterium sp. 663a-19]|uniref:hypothetical protein n=1 Tax=Mycobacterium sp. 663a-19 TaxID=2986148 RepID=UPI002D1F37EB|nr:hypothetical protein [Mycobacterium sp. 663a-19]MEB3982868.1 hypothetical protein [Mycobacterium sp. 663a-19]
MPKIRPPQPMRMPTPDRMRRRLTTKDWDEQKAPRLAATWLAVQHRARALNPPRIRESATSAMIVVILAIGVVWNLPDAAITRAVVPLLRPIALPLGLDQNWSMYAPNPPQRQENIEVHVAMADGSDKVWTLPRLNPVFGVAFSHRWRKFKETLLTEQQTRPDFVHWVVREMTRPGDHPVRVDMRLRTEDIPPPGVSGPRRTAVETLYSEELTGNR